MISEPNSLEKSAKDGPSSWVYPVTKRQAISYLGQDVRVSLDGNLAENITKFLQSVGADNEIPENKADRVSWLNHFHMQLAVNNPLWPEDMSFEFIYSKFVNAIMYDRVQIKGHNVKEFIHAFKRWITQSGVMDDLRQRWYEMNPEKAPKTLPAMASMSEEEREQSDRERASFLRKMYGENPPESIQRLIKTLEG